MAILNGGTVNSTNAVKLASYNNSNLPAGEIGMIIYNTDEETVQLYNGTEWLNIGEKSFAATGGTGLKIVNSDDVFEKYLKQAQLDFKMQASQGKERDIQRAKAKAVTAKRKDNYLEGRLGLVIDGTGKDYGKISSQAAGLKTLGYEVQTVH